MHYHRGMTIKYRLQREGLLGGWLRDLAVAGAFLTRLPFRPTPPVDMADLGPATRVFPLVGLVVGNLRWRRLVVSLAVKPATHGLRNHWLSVDRLDIGRAA